MRFNISLSFVLLGLLDLSAAWTLCQPSTRQRTEGFHHHNARGRALHAMASPPADLHEFDHLLHENDMVAPQSTTKGSRRVIKLGGDEREIVLTSSTATATATEDLLQSAEEGEGAAGDEYDYDPYADIDYQKHMGKIQEVQQEKPSLEERIKEMDVPDLFFTLFIPAAVAFGGLRWGFNKVSTRVADNADMLLDSFANEMIYHDGNEEEMRMCYSDYGRKLVWMGPTKSDAMIKRYLQAYAKKKTVSPQSIRTLSYVFALFKLSEERAAEVLVSLCRAMGTDKISSAGKILFFGSRILRSPEGVQGLNPIKDMIKSTYRDATVAETLVETSQQAIGEAAYRTAVLNGGKSQKRLTPGWEVLGLDKDTATRIFQEEAEEGFISDREAMYGGQTQKYDKKGRRIDDEGKLENPEEADDDDDEDDDGPGGSGAGAASNVYQCQECGYTLFIAKGREFKFYGDDFKCPECGAGKDKFKPANLEED